MYINCLLIHLVEETKCLSLLRRLIVWGRLWLGKLSLESRAYLSVMSVVFVAEYEDLSNVVTRDVLRFYW